MVLCTTGTIIETLRDRGVDDVNYRHVDYALRRTGIEPLGRVGFCRVFPPSAVEKVEHFIKAIRQKSQSQDCRAN